MKKLNIIIILLVILIIIIGIGILFTSGILQQSNNMKTIALSNTCSINVSQSDTNISSYADTIKMYNDTKNNIAIVSYNSQEAFNGTGNALGGAVAFAGIRDGLTVGENIGELNGFSLYKCNGYYSAKLVNNVTHDNIVIVCKDVDLLKKIVSSAKFNTKNVTTNNTVNTTQSSSNEISTTNNNHSTSNNPSTSNNKLDTSREAYEAAAERKDADLIRRMNDQKIANGEPFDPSF